MTCPNSPGPAAAFAATQTLLDERAAESTPKTPATSDYLLTGLVQCLSCRGAYVGVSAHGRNGIYRYYACRTRQAKGARACPGQRLPADDLEAAVIDDLLGIYDNLDLFQESIVDAYQDAEQEQPRLQAELASTDAQLRDATTAIDRYLRAFEAGTMPDSVCAPRLAGRRSCQASCTAALPAPGVGAGVGGAGYHQPTPAPPPAAGKGAVDEH